jgi:hypothetical protein
MTESVKSTVFGIKRSSLSKTIDFTSPMRRFYTVSFFQWKLIIRNFIFLLPETDSLIRLSIYRSIYRSILVIFRKNIQNFFQVAKHDQAEFQPATQTDLDKFLTFFQENFRIFQKNS